MYHVSIQTHFAAAHHLRHYNGQCENLHGHNWKVEVHVAAEHLDEAGMVLDFTVLKQKTNDLVRHLDHHNLNEIPPFTTINPSSENIAAHLYALLAEALKEYNVTLTTVSVWESENSKASYTP